LLFHVNVRSHLLLPSKMINILIGHSSNIFKTFKSNIPIMKNDKNRVIFTKKNNIFNQFTFFEITFS